VPVDAVLAAQLGVSADEAFVISDVSRGRPAEAAGLQRWDVVVGIEGEAASIDRLRDVLRGLEEDDTLEMTVLREGQRRKLEIVRVDECEQPIGPPAAPVAIAAICSTCWSDALSSTTRPTVMLPSAITPGECSSTTNATPSSCTPSFAPLSMRIAIAALQSPSVGLAVRWVVMQGQR